ncbi:MAG: PSD1 and planctomycete cytochrome C domain-containing protein [Acidobacteriota bacterium]|nr:PSD1 and planctomycete cytochrome C domain-containing protein [Acidobacteriota bacterium]
MSFHRLSIAAWLVVLSAPVGLGASDSGQAEFFEKRIRPLLVERCHACHSGETSSPMGGLRLDSADAMLAGGSRGPAVTPGSPEESLLVRAVSFEDADLKMPPTGRLSDREIADLVQWVRSGAFFPQAGSTSTDQGGGIDWEAGRRFWSFRPIEPPRLPAVEDSRWVSSPVDTFVLSGLEAKGLTPAPPADRRSWLRRVTFGLTGLPPSASEVERFEADHSPESFRRVVDRLLSSPHYGERWGRHWLDLVSFAETNGHEFDHTKADVWRYRDAVIRAFNQDVPYDRFVREHVAGDLLAEKRLGPDGIHWESPVGTSFFWLGERLNGAIDSVKARADEVDNQIDVLSKAFLGLTVACARCHDHKFDPIPTSDYYALAGVLHSTDFAQAVIDSASRRQEIASLRQRIRDRTSAMEALLKPARWSMARQIEPYLLAAAELASPRASAQPSAVAEVAGRRLLDAGLLQAWVETLRQACGEPEDLFYPLAALIDGLASRRFGSFAEGMEAVRGQLGRRVQPEGNDKAAGPERVDVLFEDFGKPDFEGWTVRGQAFGTGPARGISSNQPLRDFQGQPLANSFSAGSNRFMGSLTSRKFTLPELPRDYRDHGIYLHVRLAGRQPEVSSGSQPFPTLALSLIADGVRSSTFVPQGSRLQWKTSRMTIQVGRICHFEILDRSAGGHIVVDKIVFSNSKEPPLTLDAPHRDLLQRIVSGNPSSLDALVRTYRDLFLEALGAPSPLAPGHRWLLASLSPGGRLEDLGALLWPQERDAVARMQGQRQVLDDRVPASRFAMSSQDRDPRNVRVHLRGDHKNLGREVPRRFLQILAGKDQPPIPEGSGRLQLADRLVDPRNPLTARVMVNRIWKHHFGEGLVRSVDNFGKQGDRPSHPELLDFLAHRFMREGWSVKAIQRLILLSSTYRMSGRKDARAMRLDPGNRLLHHVSVRRLEAEAVRDSVLAVSGNLDRQLFGPSVPPHISPYQDGRGKPKSGPLNGNGRRSLYVQVRRNFLTPLFLAFDYPPPISTIGRRGVSTVPSQALMMLNNEFIAGEARDWARRMVAEETDPGRRAERMVLEAYGRPPEQRELKDLLQFAASAQDRYRGLAEKEKNGESVEQRVWADLGHALMNSAEFIYLR